MPDDGQDAVVEGVGVCGPVGIRVVLGAGHDVVHEVEVEIEEFAAAELVYQPS